MGEENYNGSVGDELRGNGFLGFGLMSSELRRNLVMGDGVGKAG